MVGCERWLGERWLGERWLGERWLGERSLGERWLCERWLCERWLWQHAFAACSFEIMVRFWPPSRVQFEETADAELSWLAEAERKLLSLGRIRLEQNETVAQLQAQKVSFPVVSLEKPPRVARSLGWTNNAVCSFLRQVFSMDILRHKDTLDSIVRTGEAILKSKDEGEKQALQVKNRNI